MLIPRPILDAIERGDVSLQFRTWKRPMIRPGTTLRTAVGELIIESVDVVDPAAITDDDARAAGAGTRTDLLAYLTKRDGSTYRIALRRAGPDRRVALRESADLSDDEVLGITRTLDTIDRRSLRGPWTRGVLALIRDRPGELAADLASSLGREKLPFKADVRRLKELGLTESLPVGYRLSPRGRSYLSRSSDARR